MLDPTGSSPTPPTLVDGAALDVLADAVGPENLPMVMDLVIESVATRRHELRSGCTSHDLGSLERVAHQLKSDCRQMGAADLAGKLQQIESGAHIGSLPGAADVERLIAQLEVFVAAVRQQREARAAAVEQSATRRAA